MTRARISPHFVVEEFDCHNGERVPGVALDPLRRWAEEWGEPMRKRFGAVHVSSGFRPERYNQSVGGAPASLHVYNAVVSGGYRCTRVGVAADVTCATGTPAIWAAWALGRGGRIHGQNGQAGGGVGRYPSFVHLDTGPRRTWKG